MLPIEIKRQPEAADLGYIPEAVVEAAPSVTAPRLIEDTGPIAPSAPIEAAEVTPVAVVEPVAPVTAPASPVRTSGEIAVPVELEQLEQFLYSDGSV
jgi:hypothetical protein